MPTPQVADQTLDRFLALPDDQKRAALGQMSSPTRQSLLASINARQSAPAAAAAPGPVKRLLTSAAGIPENVDTSAATAKSDLSKLGDPSAWGSALKQAISGMNPFGGQPEAASIAIARGQQPGFWNKFHGASEYLDSAIPYAGPSSVQAEEKALQGDMAGSTGSAINTAISLLMMHGMPKDTAEMIASKSPAVSSLLTRGTPAAVAEGPLRTAAQFLTTGGKSTIDQLQAAHNARMTIARTAAELSDKLPALRERARIAAKAAYPDIAGTADATDIHASLQSALDTYLKGTNRAPASIARIMHETAAPADLLEQASIFRGQGKEGRVLRGQPLAEMGFTPEKLARVVSQMDPQTRAIYEKSASTGRNATGKLINFETLHGYYSEMGNELSRPNLPGDERAALNAGRAALLKNHMEPLADAAHARPQFEAAQAGWRTFKNTFDNTDAVSGGGSPLAQALRTKDPVTGKLRPDYVRDILANPKAFEVAKEHLARYDHLNAPTDTLDAMKSAADALRSSKQKITKPPTSIFDPVAERRRILQSKAPTGVSPGLFWKYAVIRNMIRKLTNTKWPIDVQDYLSQNPK